MDPGGSGGGEVEGGRGEGSGTIVGERENSAEHEEAARQVIGVWERITFAFEEAGSVKGL